MPYQDMPPQIGPEVPLDITIHHVHITPEKKLEFQETIQDDPLLKSLAETIVAGEDGLILKGETLVIPRSKGRRYYTRSMKDTKESPSASTEHNIVFTGQASTKTSNAC